MSSCNLQVIYDDFQMMFPLIAEEVVEWEEHDFNEIVMLLNDGTRMLYNYHLHSLYTFKEQSDILNMSDEEWKHEFMMRFRRKLYSRGISQITLAERTGISEISISNYLTGKSMPSLSNLTRIARVLECSTDELLCLE